MSDYDPLSPEIVKASRKLWRADERRIMDYFWNTSSRSRRPFVPIPVIYFLEADRPGFIPSRIERALTKLRDGGSEIAGEKTYIQKTPPNDGKSYDFTATSTGSYKLTADGIEYIKDRHPAILQFWEKALELSPPTLSLFIVVVGVVADILGIILFVYWYRHLPH